MVHNNSDAKSLLKKMDHTPKAFFLFHPEGNYVNALSLYTAVKKTLDQKYYGAGKAKRKAPANKQAERNDEHALPLQSKKIQRFFSKLLVILKEIPQMCDFGAIILVQFRRFSRRF